MKVQVPAEPQCLDSIYRDRVGQSSRFRLRENLHLSKDGVIFQGYGAHRNLRIKAARCREFEDSVHSKVQ